MTLTAGARLGPYEILSAIGAGGMGEVYRARDPRLGRDVAIKVLPVAFSTDVDRLHRFEQEARAAAALNHPNILAVFDIGTDAGAPFIVSELLEGATLRDFHAGPVPVRKAVAYAVAIARGLAAAHEKGITHRDLKPENVFITTDDRVKILDFGLAKLTSDPSAANALETVTQTEPGAVLGTVGYMSPEQVRGLAVDHRADLFALGVILYELVSGQRAFRRDTAAETMAAILNEAPPRSPRDRTSDAAGPRAHHRALSGEESRGTIPDGQRSGVRARRVVRPVGLGKSCRRRRTAGAAWVDRMGRGGAAADVAGGTRVPAGWPATACALADTLRDFTDR